jgi:predicted HTH domain antitoxin
MVVTIEVPDAIAHHLGLDSRPGQRVLEALVLEGYRKGDLSRGQVSELLGLNFSATEHFLHEHGATLGLTEEDLAQDAANLQKALAG